MSVPTYRTRTRPQHLQERPAIDGRYPLVRRMDEVADRFELNVGRPILRPEGWERDMNHWRNRRDENLRRQNAQLRHEIERRRRWLAR